MSSSLTIGVTSQLQPSRTAAGVAFKFWNLVAMALIITSIYLSFTSAWWWFLLGIAAVLVLVTANGTANQRNLLNAAMVDREFYEKVADLGGWHFKMRPEDARPYLTALDTSRE